MICRDKQIFWSLIALALGFAGGYFFSSRFCKVTVVKRVEKEIALNQTLRSTLAEHAFWIHNIIRASFFNTPDQQSVENRLIKNQEQLAKIFAAYYGKSAASELNTLITQNTALIHELVQTSKENKPLTELSNEWHKNTEAIATLLAKLSPEWASSYDTLKAGLDQQLALVTQEIEALQKNNWPRAIEIFDTHLEFANQIADQLDKGITTQFPEKF